MTLKLSPKGKLGVLLAESIFANIGFFSAFSVLAIYSVTVLRVSAATAGGLMLFAALSSRLARVFVAPVYRFVPRQLEIPVAMGLGAIGYAIIGLRPSIVAVVLGFLFVGIGYGMNSVLGRTMATTFVDSTSLLTRFSVLSTATNIGAAIGPLVGSLLLSTRVSWLFWFSSVCFAVGGTIALFLTRQTDRRLAQSLDWRSVIGQFRDNRHVVGALVLTMVGWAFYAQLFSAFPLFVHFGLHRERLLGTFYAAEAIVIILVSVPINSWLARRRERPKIIVAWALTLYSLGFVLMALIENVFAGYLMMITAAIAETLLMPALNVNMTNAVADDDRYLALMMYAVGAGIGESLGNFAGTFLGTLSSSYHQLNTLFWGLCVASAGCAIVLFFRQSVWGIDRSHAQ